MSDLISIISAGAAMGLVRKVLAGRFDAEKSQFGAVGAMQENFLSGAPCDLLILAKHQLDALHSEGRIGVIHDLGSVSTGLALCSAQTAYAVTDEQSLRRAYLQASKLYVPDMQRSSAGQHVANVLKKLGISEQMQSKISEHPNGATAMKAMATKALAGELNALGCTQATEILYTEGVKYIGALPQGFELNTLYCAAIPAQSALQSVAKEALQALCSDEISSLRALAGFNAV